MGKKSTNVANLGLGVLCGLLFVALLIALYYIDTNRTGPCNPDDSPDARYSTALAPSFHGPSRDARPPADNPARNAEPRETVGQVRMKVVDAKIDVVSATDLGQPTESVEKIFIIDVRIRNLSDTRKVNYVGAGGQMFLCTAQLVDNFGNHYRGAHCGFGSKVVGQVRVASIYPGESVTDRWLFETPVAGASWFTLTIPGDSVGEKEPFVFRIRAADIEWN